MKQTDVIIRRERPCDYREVENLTREAFWNVYRPGCWEHYLLHRYRSHEGFIPELDLVMVREGKIIGHIMYVHAEIQVDGGGELPVMTFGPISIAPEYQRRGYGKMLLDYSMEEAKKRGAKVLCIEGNIDFYGKSGFVVAGTKGIRFHADPGSEITPHFLLKELRVGALSGVTGIYHTPAGYFVDEKEVEKFDATFPPKEKLKLPGQLE